MKLTPPAVRFVRVFDTCNLRMANIWIALSTQEQIDNSPLSTELTVQAKTVEEAMIEICKTGIKWLDAQTIAEIKKSAERITPAKPSFYGTLDELKSA